MIVQSRATAHVYRLFGALMALLLMMALAVGLMRVRSDRPMSSPYGALDAIASSRGVSSVSASIIPAVLPQPSLPAPAAITQPSTAVVAEPPGTGSTARIVSGPTDDTRASPRQIALDKFAASSAVPQPAPPAAVQAATRVTAAAAPVPNTPAADQGEAAGDGSSPGPQPARVAARTVDSAVVANTPAANSGRVNINTASIDQLNNVGAGHIGRTIARHRPYRSLEDLVAHRVLTARDYARIRSAITVE